MNKCFLRQRFVCVLGPAAALAGSVPPVSGERTMPVAVPGTE